MGFDQLEEYHRAFVAILTNVLEITLKRIQITNKSLRVVAYCGRFNTVRPFC